MLMMMMMMTRMMMSCDQMVAGMGSTEEVGMWRRNVMTASLVGDETRVLAPV
jgi:hypothetical protein